MKSVRFYLRSISAPIYFDYLMILFGGMKLHIVFLSLINFHVMVSLKILYVISKPNTQFIYRSK